MNLKNPIKVDFNQQNYLSNIAVYESRIEYFQNITDKIKLVVPTIIFEKEDLILLFNNPKEFFATKLIPENATVGGIELDKTKVFELLSCTAELKEIINEIEFLNRNNNAISNKNFLERNAQYYFINESDNVEMKPETINQLEESNSKYIKTEKQKAVFDCLQKFKDAFDELKTILPSENLNRVTEIFFEIPVNGGTVEMKPSAILRY